MTPDETHNDAAAGFTSEDVEFPSCGVRLRGVLLLPMGGEGPYPVVVMAPGLSGVKEGSIFKFAAFLAQAGFAVLAYDHINFGASEGLPRQEADPQLQRRGYRDAISYAALRPEVDRKRIGVWGTSYSGGHVLEVAAHDRRVKCVVSQIGMISGFQLFRRMALPHRNAVLRAMEADREGRFTGKPPAMVKAVSNSAVRFVTRLEVPPGRYQARFGVREAGGGLIGTVFDDLEIPDFANERLSMSGMALTSTRALQVLTARPDKELQDLLAGPPSAGRTFTPGDSIGAFVEVYDNVTSPPHQVELVSSVRADDGRLVFSSSEERHSSELDGSRGGFHHVVDISLNDVKPGGYVLRIEARSRLENEFVVAREAPFTVVDAATTGR